MADDLENYDSHGLQPRSCSDMMRKPHRAHDWEHPDLGSVHCWGRNRLPADAEEKYCTEGCKCDHCVDVRKGLWPRTIMCSQRWESLSSETREQTHESLDG